MKTKSENTRRRKKVSKAFSPYWKASIYLHFLSFIEMAAETAVYHCTVSRKEMRGVMSSRQMRTVILSITE